MANIVHFGKYYFPVPGGIESVTLGLARGAVIARHSVSVICFRKSKEKCEEVIDGVLVFRSPITKFISTQPIGFKYIYLCLKAAKRADVIHLHAPNILAAICAFFIGNNARLLVHWHSDIIGKGLLGKIVSPLESALLRRADCIVATSRAYADSSEMLAPFQGKIAIVPIGVSEERLRAVRGGLPPHIEERVSGKKIILSVGRLVPYKGFDVLIHSARYLSPDSVVVIVGGGPLHGDLQEAIDSAGVSDRVLLVGRLDDAELNALFEMATLYCLSSSYRAEAFGVVLLEAMAYGLPIVASNIPGSGVPWVNQHGVSGMNVPVGDPIALAQACNQILGSVELRERLSSGARNRFLSEFTEEISIKRMMACYDQILKDKN